MKNEGKDKSHVCKRIQPEVFVSVSSKSSMYQGGKQKKLGKTGWRGQVNTKEEYTANPPKWNAPVKIQQQCKAAQQ